MQINKIFIFYFVVINCIAYFLMWYDKFQSKNKGSRISENMLFFIALIFGALGIYLGMKAPIFHKASKLKFKYGIPLIVILHFVLLFYYFICI